MKNLFEHTNAFWAKYAAYEWRLAADGKEYLLPTNNAEAAVYNIMKVADQLVLDALLLCCSNQKALPLGELASGLPDD